MAIRRTLRRVPREAADSQHVDAAPSVRARPAEGRAETEAIARTEAYRRLVARRRRFTLVAGGLFYAVFAAFVVLAAWAHEWMAARVVRGLSVGYLAALVVVVAVWVLVFAYSRASVRTFDPLARDAREARRR
jgi:uncharacterized membrane protein (DUF485 family)